MTDMPGPPLSCSPVYALTQADADWLRSRYPRTFELLREDIERHLACAPLEGAAVIRLESGTVVEVRAAGAAVVPS
jgi:hypothetical protein